EAFADLRDLATKWVHNRLLALDRSLRWKEDPHDYYDKILSTRYERRRVTFHLKILEQLDPAHSKGVEDYSRALLELTQTSLIRSEYCYLL
ncbi:MAG: hypothetical protein GW789_02050, partial [Ignavibacteria bacterium]|nr:hypothetical protein [Ignavibacteria bacterium]